MVTCPSCNHKFTAKKQPYSESFIEFWDRFDVHRRAPTSSKTDAMKAWDQIESARPSQPRLLAALKGYLAQIDKDNSPACHPATWLRQARYENFLPPEIVESTQIMQAPTYVGWPTDISAKLIKLIGEPKFKVWLADAKFTAGTISDAAVIVVDTDLKRSYLETKLASTLSACLGHFEVHVKQGS